MFDDLDYLAEPKKVSKEEKEQQKFPCSSCAGTGIYKGFSNNPDKTCFSCGGRGFHLQSPEKRKAANAKRKITRAKNIALGQAALLEEHKDLIIQLSNMEGWNQFAASLMQQFRERGKLSDKQILAAHSMIEKMEAKKEAKKQVQNENSGEVNVSVIKELFDNAKESGLKRPKFRTDVLEISLAPEHGRNAGALYVKHEGEYAGKIVNGNFFATSSANTDTLGLVQEIASDPLNIAKMYGKKTGKCCCCGRELTDPNSIAAGIGPICESNWF